jgi:glutamyl-tRNA reductase
MRKDVEAVRERESLRIARLHPELSKETIDTITRTLVNRLLHTPSERLREMGDTELAERLADLFVQPAGSL